jgi:hypothetical protein
MRVEKARGADRQDLWINNVWRCRSAGGPIGARYCSGETLAFGVLTGGGTTRGMALSYHRVIQAPATAII